MADDVQRDGRMVERAIIKRKAYADRIRAIHALALRSLDDQDNVPELYVAVGAVDAVRAAFSIEDDAVLDGLLNLNRVAEYDNDLATELWGLINFSTATYNRFSETTSAIDNASVQSVPASENHMDVEQNDNVVDREQSDAPQLYEARREPAPIDFGARHTPPSICAPAIRLPEIPLPTFFGDIFKWPSFRDRFVAMVDQRPNMSNSDKVYYLVGCLTGDAVDVIRGIPVSGDTYKFIWATLEAKFDKPRLVACSVMESLLTAPVSNSETLFDLNQFITTFDESISILQSLRIPDLGDFIIFSLASRCLPSSCRTMFESQTTVDYPSARDLFNFVKTRISILERVQRPQRGARRSTFKQPTPQPSRPVDKYGNNMKGYRKVDKQVSSLMTNNQTPASNKCTCCKGGHALTSCPQFKGWSTDVRSNWAREQRLCFRCLMGGHWAPKCAAQNVCAVCARKHHTLVHKDVNPGDTRPERKPAAPSDVSAHASSLVNNMDSHSVLLGTALVHIRDCAGAFHTARALVDSASQICAITSECASRLGLHMTRWTAPVSGLAGASVSNVLGIVDCHVQPRYSDDPILPFKAWVFPAITAMMPHTPLSHDLVSRYSHLALADPWFSLPADVDILLGADIFAKILDGKRISVGAQYPVAFSSVFGWLVIGSVPSTVSNQFHSCPTSLTLSVESMMDKFWRTEEPEPAPEEFTNDGHCESLFTNGCTRDSLGRFSVPLPFSRPVSSDEFRGSREVATKRFDQLERKLSSDHQLREKYQEFMAEYISLGHMSIASSPGKYFIPHHAVYRASDEVPKIRVVFDASARSWSGLSLNSCLYVGPKLQRDVIDVLMLFRLPRYAFTADICKMYRQISISPQQRCYQHILWRPSPHDQLCEYTLNTVTYGVTCAPFLAIRVLHAIADQDCDDFPLVKQALLYHTYVDDICVGADTEVDAVNLQSDLITVLGRSCMELKKWTSNTPSLLINVPPEDKVVSDSQSFTDSDSDGVRVLGLRWNNREDTFNYSFHSEKVTATKRGMLSMIARIFDPIGLLAPVVFFAKHLMQRVWQSELAWDEPLPPELKQAWLSFVLELPELQKVNIPRFIGTHRDVQAVLCGFCDASTRGYAAVVYLRIEHPDGTLSVSLMGCKTKLAPIKETTIPRLELCAAVLLARWMARIRTTVADHINVTHSYAWSDSMVVLNWLLVRHESFKVFVSNRIHQVQTLLPGCHWNYVKSTQNPADCASRGLMPSALIHHELYWKGPSLLQSSISDWVTTVLITPVDELPEVRSVTQTVLHVTEHPEWYAQFSSYIQLIRVTAVMRRFINQCRQRRSYEIYLTRRELDEATLVLVRSSQAHFFDKLRREISNSSPVSVRPIARLRPFVDDRSIICVGGRLSHSTLAATRKHPMLLSKSSYLSLLLVRHWHEVTGHGGPRVLTSLINRQFWVLSMRSLIRSVISRCTRCVRLSSVNPQPVMADLPQSRVSECRPFSRVGIDYAGPLLIKEHRLRKARQFKVYIAVFVCFAVKAVHLELVSDLTTDAFLAAMNRFVARRGMPTDIFTDCGTNFVGADRLLRDLVNDPSHRNSFSAGVQCLWHFNPPASPHFGGLWEAAVKSAKSLLVRIMGEHTFTLEELSTILCRVEAILNSRPLTPASTDPDENDCLTPGHFLIGQPLLAVPEADVPAAPRNLLNRWKLVNQCAQSFWRRWRDEYLHTLQSRSKWTKDSNNIEVNDMVVIKDPHSPPLKWHLARVHEVLPGTDGVVRVVRLRTPEGYLIRPVVKLVKLPITQ